ncbi:hypothetical protein EJB05_06423, partial [Eragrostis curvula]
MNIWIPKGFQMAAGQTEFAMRASWSSVTRGVTPAGMYTVDHAWRSGSIVAELQAQMAELLGTMC